MAIVDGVPSISLHGQVPLVTGDGRGLGRAFAQALAANGAAVTVTARSAAQVEETAQLIMAAGGQALGFPGDVTDARGVNRIVKIVENGLGPIDILINNAGIFTPIGQTWDQDPPHGGIPLTSTYAARCCTPMPFCLL